MINKKYKINWDDINSIYLDLNIQRQRFGMNTVTIPLKEKNKIVTEDLSKLNNSVIEMSSNGYISDKANTGIVIPAKKNKNYYF